MKSPTTVDIPSVRGSTVDAEVVQHDQGVIQNRSMFMTGVDEPKGDERPDEEAEPIRDVTEGDWQDTPSCLDQFSNPRWRAYRRLGPTQLKYFLIPDHIDQYNAMLASCEPVGAPSIVLIKQEPINAMADGRYSTLVLFQKVQYISIQTHDTETKKLAAKAKKL